MLLLNFITLPSAEDNCPPKGKQRTVCKRIGSKKEVSSQKKKKRLVYVSS